MVAAAVLAGCVSSPATAPGHDKPLPFQLARVQEQERNGVTVHLVIPTEEEVAAQFGVGFAEHGIQPIWLRITNTSDADLWFLPIAIDPDYDSADEAALVAGAKLPAERAAALKGGLREKALSLFHPAGMTGEGYVYASHVRGGRFVDVRLTGHRSSV
jgi:hypothetical protein